MKTKQIAIHKVYIFLIACIISLGVHAQHEKGHYVEANIGLGMSMPDDTTVDIHATGLYLQGEYVVNISRWFGFRGYAGAIFVSTDKDTKAQYPDVKISTNAFLLGAKSRLCFPIPWVAPYLELGVGVSVGSFTTQTPVTQSQKKGVLLHIPTAIGFALGRNHDVELEFSYYIHPSTVQIAGAAAIGFSFPL